MGTFYWAPLLIISDKDGWWFLHLFVLVFFLFGEYQPHVSLSPESQYLDLFYVFLPCEHQCKGNLIYWTIHWYLWTHLSCLNPHRPRKWLLKDLGIQILASAENRTFPKLPDAQPQLRPNASILLTRAHQCEVLLTICIKQCAADGESQIYAYCGCPFPAASVEPNFLC